MSKTPPWMRPADEAILKEFLNEQPSYIPLVANRLGMHLSYVEARCEQLTDRGLLEAVTNEAVYVGTDQGANYLGEELGK